MNRMKRLFKILWSIISGLIVICFVGVFFFKIVEFGLEHTLYKSETNEIAEELTSYVTANDRFLTNNMLSNYVNKSRDSGLLKKNQKIKIEYIQDKNDRRFKLKVYLTGKYINNMVNPGYSVEYTGLNFGDGPNEFLHATYKDLYSNNTNNKNTNGTLNDNKEQENIKDKGVAKNNEVDSDISEDSIKEFMSKYLYAGMDAIREGSFAIIKAYLDPNGKAYKQSQNEIININSWGIKEELINAEIIDIKKESLNTYIVTTNEKYKMDYENKPTKVNGYRNNYKIKAISSNQIYIEELLDTTLLSN